MEKIRIKVLNEDIYYEKLENGLDVYLYKKKDYHSNYVTFTTKYGSVNKEFVFNNKKITMPNGIAHFLEHKVFVQEKDPQPMDFFSQSGASSNAFTTFKNTTYLFSGPKDLEKNITFLLDFVQNSYLTDDNVNSEKGIIKEEIKMCNDRPNDVLYENIRTSIFKNNSFKESIIGTAKDIDNINKELLQTCYDTFYHPSNMFLIVVGDFDQDKVLKYIKDNQNKKTFTKSPVIELLNVKEPNEVVKKDIMVDFNTSISKCAYNIKIEMAKKDKKKFAMYLYILFSILFDETSNFDIELKEKKIITNSIFINIINCDTHILVSLINETNNFDLLYKEIDKKLSNIKINDIDFERKKRVLISNELFSYENMEIISDMFIDSIIYENKIDEKIIDILNSLNKKELDDIIRNTNFKNISKVTLKAKGTKN